MKTTILVLALVSTAHADDKKYTLAELKALVGQKSYIEAVQHLADIPPTQRTAEWIEVGGEASAGLLATVPADGSAITMIDNIDREYPALLRSAAYGKARGEAGLKALDGCFRSLEAECIPIALRFSDNSERKVSIDAARLTVTSGYPAPAVLMFKRTFDGKTSCSDPQLHQAIIAGLETHPKTPIAGDARTLMGACWDAVKDEVVKAFDAAGKNSEVYANTCETLKAKHLLSSLQTKRCK